MSARNTKPRGKQVSTPSPPLPRRGSPVILVPATRSTPGQVPIATEDELSPPQATQPSPRSYAQVAALPAALANAVVWTLSASASLSSSTVSQPTNSAASVVAISGAASPTGTNEPLAVPATPVIAPVATQLDDIADFLELPPPAFQLADLAGVTTVASAMGQANSPLPSSSPIYVPSTTASATPTPVGNASARHPPPLPIGVLASPSAGSYDEFWSNFQTPVLPDAYLPAAPQTPRVLNPVINVTQPLQAWPLSTTVGRFSADNVAPAGDENVPPLPSSDSHPPVSSRMRKRRRGITPASGERIRKSARRKGKERATDPPSAVATDLGVANPWTSAGAWPHSDTPAQSRPPIPFLLSDAAFTSSNQTPYTDYSRQTSATTSFFGRFNESGSYPTPHQISGSSAASHSSATMDRASLPTRVSVSTAATPSITRLSSARSERPMDVDWQPSSSRTSTLPRQDPPGTTGTRAITTASSSSRHEDASLASRRRLRDLLSDPRALNERSQPHRRTAIDEVPEDGELDAPQRTMRENDHTWGIDTSFGREASVSGLTLPLLEEPSWRNYAADTPWPGSRSGGFTESSPLRNLTEDHFDNDWPMHSSRRLPRNDEATRRSSPRSTFSPGDAPLLRPHRGIPSGGPCMETSTSTPSNCIRTLDIFDVGDDDNLPEAVRRGGAVTAGEDDRPTPISREGDPEVHHHDPEARFRGMSDVWVQELGSVPSDTTVTLNTFNPRFTRSYGANRRTASDFRRSISAITGETDFRIIAPDLAPDYRGRGPVEWAVTGLTREGVERLLRRRVWSFKYITFFPRRRSLEIPSLLLAVEGFLEDNVANIELAVRSTFERPQVRHRIEQMIRANPEFIAIPADEALRRVMSSLRVTVYTLDNGTVVANVFLHSPTQSVRVWRQWVQELRELTFGSYHTAIARSRRISSCAGCLGVDHPSHLCPFPRMPGWNGPESAGGPFYSADGHERRGQQARPGSLPPHDAQLARRQRRQAVFDQGPAQAGPPRSRSSNFGRDSNDPDFEQGRDRGREHGRERDNCRGGRGAPRRGRKDDSWPPKSGRDGCRKDGRK